MPPDISLEELSEQTGIAQADSLKKGLPGLRMPGGYSCV